MLTGSIVSNASTSFEIGAGEHEGSETTEAVCVLLQIPGGEALHPPKHRLGVVDLGRRQGVSFLYLLEQGDSKPLTRSGLL